LEIVKILGERFKKAREFLGISQNAIAKEIGISNQSIGRIESNQITNPNWLYITYLIKNGINPYFLIGVSTEVEGQKVEGINHETYETLKNELESLKTKNTKLQKEMKGMVSRSEFEEVTHKLEAYAEIIRMLKNEKS